MKFTLAFFALAALAVAMPAPNPERGNRGAGRGRSTQAAAATPVEAVAAVDGAVVVPAGSGAAAGVTSSSRAAAAAATGASSGSTGTGTGTGTPGTSSGSSGSGHQLTVNNNCGSGHVEWRYNGAELMQFSGSTLTWDKSIEAGVMWLQDYDGHHCGANGDDCGTVEFTLGAAQDFNAINYSLLHGSIAGNHVLRAPMMIALAGGGCDVSAPGVCTGMTEAECPSGFTGEDPESGDGFPVCTGKNVGIVVTFCP